MYMRLNNGQEFEIESINNEFIKSTNKCSLTIIMPKNVSMDDLMNSINEQDLSSIYIVENDQVVRTYTGYELCSISENFNNMRDFAMAVDSRNSKVSVLLAKDASKK